jgi:poly(3-hydroxybutyrate) depolymerase
MTMNLDRHVKAHKDLFQHLVRGDGDSAERHREFYDEYLAVMDLTAEFYLQTVDSVFVRHLLPQGWMTHRGRRVDLRSIKRVALMTIEGENDDITGTGQCRAAHDLCSSVPPERKAHFECPHVGHYGIFNGSRFRLDIAPRIAAFARAHDPRTTAGIMMPALDRNTAIARAAGHMHELAASAFSFRAANDEAPDAIADKVRARGLAAIGDGARAPFGFAGSAGLACLGAWQLAGSLFLHGLSCMRLESDETDAHH